LPVDAIPAEHLFVFVLLFDFRRRHFLREGQLMAYFEKGCPRSQVRGAKLNSTYRAEWFDPR
jgi:hypothetical protein